MTARRPVNRRRSDAAKIEASQRVRCAECGKVCKSYVPAGGNGTYRRPYRHTNVETGQVCDGRFREGAWLSDAEALEADG